MPTEATLLYILLRKLTAAINYNTNNLQIYERHVFIYCFYFHIYYFYLLNCLYCRYHFKNWKMDYECTGSRKLKTKNEFEYISLNTNDKCNNEIVIYKHNPELTGLLFEKSRHYGIYKNFANFIIFNCNQFSICLN